ncbi:MAG: hypothetical protein KME26_12425 [Oscillatoria princeps RMCB-10]|jgi:hypothetical protein|nr:hypothetical protein [Oscillatoria princeps RMCB-10]
MKSQLSFPSPLVSLVLAPEICSAIKPVQNKTVKVAPAPSSDPLQEDAALTVEILMRPC